MAVSSAIEAWSCAMARPGWMLRSRCGVGRCGFLLWAIACQALPKAGKG